MTSNQDFSSKLKKTIQKRRNMVSHKSEKRGEYYNDMLHHLENCILGKRNIQFIPHNIL